MHGLMMDRPLLLKRLLWRAERVFGDQEVVTWRRDHPEGNHRYTYAEYGRRVRRLIRALERLGVAPGDRVGTLAWNTHRHYETYFAVPGMGAVLHTINLRLFPEQIKYVINHAKDSVLLVEEDQLELVESLRDDIPGVKAFVVMADGALPQSSLEPLYSYEELLADQEGSEDFELPELDENTAAALCFTSATTGDPKGVLYSHRSMVLHSLGLSVHGSIGVREDKSYLVISPLFHANAWGLPHACAMQGAKLVLPGRHPTPADYLGAIESEGVTHAVGAVTVGVMMREALERSERSYDLKSLEVLWLGGSAPPRSQMEWWQQHYGVDVPQGWGMTESSPLVSFTTPKRKMRTLGEEELYRVRSKQGLPLPLVEIEVLGEKGEPLPWDGRSVGEFALRGPWVARAYLDDSRSAKSFRDGWFLTGDVGVIDPDGYVQLMDRSKDLIKSGGEWISSVELENALTGHPDVAEAGVVAVPDERWQERPLAYVVRRPGAEVEAKELRDYLADRFAKWWLPDDYLFLDELPKTGVGKIDKKLLRSRYQDPASRPESEGSSKRGE